VQAHNNRHAIICCEKFAKRPLIVASYCQIGPSLTRSYNSLDGRKEEKKKEENMMMSSTCSHFFPACHAGAPFHPKVAAAELKKVK